MTAIGYGIIIGALIGLGLFAGAALALKVKVTPNWQPFDLFGGKNEEEEIRQAGRRVKPTNYDEGPATAEEFHAKFKRDSHSEELPSGKR